MTAATVRGIQVRAVVSQQVVTVSSDTTIHALVHLIRGRRIGGVPFVDDGRLVDVDASRLTSTAA